LTLNERGCVDEDQVTSSALGTYPGFWCFLYFIIRVVSAGPFPDSVPIHFDFSGIPNKYGSPWSVFGFTIGYSLLLSASQYYWMKSGPGMKRGSHLTGLLSWMRL
jgi:hypothetical protein